MNNFMPIYFILFEMDKCFEKHKFPSSLKKANPNIPIFIRDIE